MPPEARSKPRRSETDADAHMKQNGNAAAESKTALAYEPFTFDSLLDETCERLLDRQLKYSIQRIHELEKRLGKLEDELDEFLRNGA